MGGGGRELLLFKKKKRPNTGNLVITTPVVGARAQSLVGELRSHAEQGGQMLKKKKKQSVPC